MSRIHVLVVEDSPTQAARLRADLEARYREDEEKTPGSAAAPVAATAGEYGAASASAAAGASGRKAAEPPTAQGRQVGSIDTVLDAAIADLTSTDLAAVEDAISAARAQDPTAQPPAPEQAPSPGIDAGP